MRERPEDLNRTARRRSVLFLVAALLGVATCAAACGPGDQSRSAKSGKSAPQAPSSHAAPGKGVVERLWLVTPSGRHEIRIEVADTDEKKQVGLMFRTSLDDGYGMLFPYPEPQEITMWMRNTYVSLDMVFIGADGTVHRIESNTEPMSKKIIASNGPASAVLELKAGAAAHYQIAPGSRLEHPLFNTASGR